MLLPVVQQAVTDRLAVSLTVMQVN